MVTSKPMIPAGTLYSVQSLTELTEMLQERPAYCVRGSDPLTEMLRRSLAGPKPCTKTSLFDTDHNEACAQGGLASKLISEIHI